MPRQSAGILAYRHTADDLEVLLAHPGGPFWARKDEGAWTIPKGEIETGEEPLATARREFEEELGVAPVGTFIPLEPVRQPSGKLVHAWALAMDFDPGSVTSQSVTVEWPPRSGRLVTFPEIDRVSWFPIETARRKILKGQTALLDHLLGVVIPPHTEAQQG